MARILIVDDEQNIRRSLKQALENRGHDCVTAGNLAQGREYVRAEFDLVLLDIMLGDGSGLDLLAEILKRNHEQCVVMISGHADIETAVSAIQKGAYDFIEKPISLDRLLVTVENGTRTKRLSTEKERLSHLVYGEMIGESEAIRKTKQEIKRAAPKVDKFLITGENGTGKELAAHMIHQHSRYAKGPFIPVNCASLPSELVESELFGHVKGAFTGANRDRLGRFREADSGSLFLDEISEMSLEAQAKILRVLESRQIGPVGSGKLYAVTGNIIAATNRNLEDWIRQGRFREDLFYRLNVVTLTLPPLRKRKSDIPLLAEYFLGKFAAESGMQPPKLTRTALTLLKSQPFPGNIRELKNLIERLSIYCESAMIKEADLKPFLAGKGHDDTATLKDALDQFEKEQITSAIKETEGNMAEAARKLGLERSHLYKKIRKLGIEPPG